MREFMRTYKMIGLNILIDYKFDTFYTGNIEAYLTLDKPEYFIYTHLVDSIDMPKLPLKNKTDKRTFYENETYEYVVYHNQKEEPLTLIQRRKDYKEYHIYLNQLTQAPLDGIEYTIHQMVFMEIAVEKGFTPIHSSAFTYHKKAYLISAPSGVGKTTLSKRMAKLYGSDIINDDKPLLKIVNDEIFVYSSPFSGKEAKNQNTIYPLGSIIFLEQSLRNEFRVLSNNEAINHLLKNTFRPDKKDLWENSITVMNKLIEDNKIVLYQCVNDNSSGVALKEYLDKWENKK